MYFFIIFSILILFPAIGIFAFLVMNDKAKKEEKKENAISEKQQEGIRPVSLWIRVPLVTITTIALAAILAIIESQKISGDVCIKLAVWFGYIWLTIKICKLKTRKPHPGKIVHFIGLSSLFSFVFVISFILFLFEKTSEGKQILILGSFLSFFVVLLIWLIYVMDKVLRSKKPKRNIPPPPFLNGQTVFVETQLPPPMKFKFSELPDRDKYFCMTLLLDLLLLFLAACDLRLPYGFYTILRIVTCVTGVWFIVLLKSPVFRFLLGLVALLYNPLIPIELDDRDAWQLFNILVIVLYIVTAIVLWRNRCRAARDGQESA